MQKYAKIAIAAMLLLLASCTASSALRPFRPYSMPNGMTLISADAPFFFVHSPETEAMYKVNIKSLTITPIYKDSLQAKKGGQQ